MSPELDKFYLTFGSNTQRVYPSGDFRIKVQRDRYQFREYIEGIMTFSRDDFWLIHSAPKCTEFFIECDFQDRSWKGVFTKKDCTVNYSKSYLEVTPQPDDDYRDFLPYTGMDMNILKPREGLDWDVMFTTTRIYETERITESITTPYTGPGHQNWTGYSVNDWLGAGIQSYLGNAKANSLIYYLAHPINFNTPLPPIRNGVMNTLAWLDYEGWLRKINGDANTLADALMYPQMFTLKEVINHYDEDKNWVSCDLVYEREVWRRHFKPPNGSFAEQNYQSYFDSLVFFQGGVAELKKRLPPAGWVKVEGEPLWMRRPLNIGGFYVKETPFNHLDTHKYGNGGWFSLLSDYIQVKDGFIKKQELAINRLVADQHPLGWYEILYGLITVEGRGHRIPTIIRKYLAFIQKQGGTSLTLQSQYLENPTSPYKKDQYGNFEENDWYHTFIIQNSDLKRIESTEPASKEEMSFNTFMDAICGIANAGWAIINGRLVVEHISYFDNGLQYSKDIDFNCTQNCNWLNPASIYNYNLNISFLRYSNQYRHVTPEMQKYEMFTLSGGYEPDGTNVAVIYDTPCANNYPDQNTREVTIDLTTDAEWVIKDGDDAGICLLRGDIDTIFAANTPIVGYYGSRMVDISARSMATFYMTVGPEQDPYTGAYKFNRAFNLRYILLAYHLYGRSFEEGEVGYDGVIRAMASRHYIQQSLFFEYRRDINPYMRIVMLLGTEVVQGVVQERLRIGRIEDAVFNCRQGILDIDIGYLEGTGEYAPPYGGGFTPGKWDGYTDIELCIHIHTQISPTTVWTVRHYLNTGFPFRPVIYQNGEEIDYNYIQVLDENIFQIHFTKPVVGEAYVLSFLCDDMHAFHGNTKVWEIQHNMNESLVLPSIILDETGREIRYDDYEVVDPDNVKISFTHPAEGDGILGVFPTDEFPVDGDSANVFIGFMPTKPYVLRLGKEISYNTSQLETLLIRVGFTKEVIASIIVKIIV